MRKKTFFHFLNEHFCWKKSWEKKIELLFRDRILSGIHFWQLEIHRSTADPSMDRGRRFGLWKHDSVIGVYRIAKKGMLQNRVGRHRIAKKGCLSLKSRIAPESRFFRESPRILCRTMHDRHVVWLQLWMGLYSHA